jgi:hypothetical protein
MFEARSASPGLRLDASPRVAGLAPAALVFRAVVRAGPGLIDFAMRIR